MSRFRTLLSLVALSCSLTIPLALAVDGPQASAATTYAPLTPQLATITNGTASAPWNLSQGDPAGSPYASQSPGTVLPTFTPGGASVAGSPNLAVYPGASSGTDGNSPYPSGTVGTPGPLDGYCGTGNSVQESLGSPARQPANTLLPLAPAYFPHVVRNADGSLTGYFDYRPKDANESIVAASSTDGGKDWTYLGQALQQNPDYCPSSDVNDDGEGHPNLITVGGTSRLYTLQRAAGDNVGVGMLVHTLNPTPSDPLNGLPTVEKIGVDPDDFAASAVTVAPGSPVTIDFAYPVGTGPEQLVAGGFIDLTQTPVPTDASIITCTGVGAQSLTGCTTTSGSITVAAGDLIEQVLGTISSNLAKSSPASACNTGSSTPVSTGSGALPCQVPTGPNTTTGDGGLEGFGITVTNPNNLNMAIFNADAPNRAYIDGVAVYCSQANALPTTKVENCTVGAGNPALTVNAGDPLTSDPIVPATAQQTSGLIAPDGIVGVLPSYPGAPAGSTIVMYTEKVLNYYIVGYTGASSKFAANMTIAFTPFPNTSAASLGSGPTYTVSIGDATKNTIVQESCSSFNAATNTLSGCNGGTVNDTISKNSYLGAPGATAVPAATLAQIAGSVSTNAQKLFKNNEDLTVLRVAYTTDGINFSSAGLDNNGIISGQSNGASSYSDITNPSSTTSPANLNAYAAPGSSDVTEMRFVGAAGTILTNPDGTYGMFLSGAWAADGDSDAFNQVFYTSSSDGEHWSIPTTVISTDYTFSASYAENLNPTQPLGISAYYSGRAYGPSVVQNADGSLTMVFAGYRLPSPAGTVGASYGTIAGQQYKIGASDPLLYRSILVVKLQSSSTPVVSTTASVSSTITSTTTVGTPVTYSATITPSVLGALAPSGTVSFSTANGAISGCEAVALNAYAPDTASCTTTYAGPIDNGVQVSYGGDANYAASSSPTLTTTTVTSSDSGSGLVGEAITYSATVADAGLGTPTPSGTVSFSDSAGSISGCNSQSLATVGTALVATCSVTYGSPVTEHVSATYNGDQNTVGSTGAFSETVAPGATTTSVSASDNGSGVVVGQPVTFTVEVGVNAPGSGTPTGTVTVTSQGSPISGCVNLTLSGGSPDSAQCSTTFTAAMNNQVSASYSGDANYLASASAPLAEVVNPASTTSAIGSSNTSIVVGQSVTFTATIGVLAPGSGQPTGTVSFTDSAGVVSPSCTNASLSVVDANLQATCTVVFSSALASPDAVSASYAGDENFATSTSAPINESVGQGSTSVTLSSSDQAQASSSASR
jgi:hypothetical protein